ncbi:MAG TPA: hypothetical protein PK156_01090 [Polyangium sp.]|nr:hypothetical protein [Polyangium sp.]
MKRRFRYGVPMGERAQGETPIATLKRTLCDATDLSEPWNQFHGLDTWEVVFGEGATHGENPRMEKVLSMIASRVAGSEGKVAGAMFMQLPAHQLWHGRCTFGRRIILFFYFEDLDIGLAGIGRMATPDDPHVDLARFSLLPVKSGAFVTNVRGSA